MLFVELTSLVLLSPKGPALLQKEPATTGKVLKNIFPCTPSFLLLPKVREEMAKALEHPLGLLELRDGEGESDDSELEGVRCIRMSNMNMLKEASEERSLRKSHVGTFGHTYHSIGNVVCKVEWFTDSKIVEHIAKACIRVVFVPSKAYDIFTKDDLPLHKIGLQFGEDHLEGIESDVYSFNLTGLAERPFGSVHTNSLTRNAKNSGEFLKTKSDFKIINDEGDGDGSIQITNEMNTFVKLKDEHEANLLVHVKNTIESNGCESRAKLQLKLHQKLHQKLYEKNTTVADTVANIKDNGEFYTSKSKEHGMKPEKGKSNDDGFKWGVQEASTFEELKQRMSTTPVLSLPDFNKVFVGPRISLAATYQKEVVTELPEELQEGQPLKKFMAICDSRVVFLKTAMQRRL
ncbi:hypothetical protein Tco_1057409 [Tanacetum coccineum]|uniref:Uncharacterized protein n=1 Tax=Tanacetum coccineum TaxID=301880 RepID=A0ABQ5H738_9ASTR